MRRPSLLIAVFVCLVGLTSSLSADVRSDQRVKFQLGGALDAPVPYSPPLEEFFLVSEEETLHAAKLLAQY